MVKRRTEMQKTSQRARTNTRKKSKPNGHAKSLDHLVGENVTAKRRAEVNTSAHYNGITYVPDTSILVADPQILLFYLREPTDRMIILGSVLGEVDNLKRGCDVRNRNARRFSSALEKITADLDVRKISEEGVSLSYKPNGRMHRYATLMFYSSQNGDGNGLRFTPPLRGGISLC